MYKAESLPFLIIFLYHIVNYIIYSLPILGIKGVLVI